MVDEAIARIPIGGWPTGLFERRDALLILLRHRAGVPSHRRVVDLTSETLNIDRDRRLHLSVGGGQVLELVAEPAVCPARIWRRWRTLLRLATR